MTNITIIMIMTKTRLFLFGVLLGELIMVPYIYHLINTPSIQVDVVPDCYEYVQQSFTHQIQNVKDYKGRIGILTIHLVKPGFLQDEYHRRFNDPDTVVMGFYDERTNEIFCVYDAQILLHELKHVFEGRYHR